MKLWKRKTLLILAFSLFFVIAPILVFYAMGYRYDFENKFFRQIGMIIIESKPDNADIFTNDKYESKTPFRIKNLLPNEYNIKVSKDGFNSWRKKLSVDSKKVTWASNIVLFYEKPEINKLSNISLDNFKISSNHKMIIASSNHKDNFGIWLINVESKQSEKIYPKNKDTNQVSLITNDTKYSNFQWSPDNKKVIASIKNSELEDYLIIDIESDNEPIYINSSYDLKTKDIQWKNDEEIYLLDESGNIHQIELNFKYAPKIILENVIDFKFSEENDEIIYISQEKNEYKLSSIKGEITNNVLNLPKDENFEIGIGNYNYVSLLFKNKKELLLINLNTNEPKVIGNNINTFKWSKNKNKILFFGNNELWFYALQKGSENETTTLAYNYNESNLLTRYSTEIKNATWYPNKEYITIFLENNIKIIELDGRGERNCQEYKNDLLVKDHFIEFDKRGENAYLINKGKILQEVKITDF